MNRNRALFLLAGGLAVGTTIMISSTFAANSDQLKVIRHSDNATAIQRPQHETSFKVEPSPEPASAVSNLTLVPPPEELPSYSQHKTSQSMVVSLQHAAPVAKMLQPQKPAVNPAPQPVIAQATANTKLDGNLFTLVRLLNYSPHPLREELLRSTPIEYNGNHYWFAVNYKEDWNVVSHDKGYIRGISFVIEVMENNEKVRELVTPKVSLNKSKIAKGQVLGIAEVAPYKFTFSVDEFTKSGKGIEELVFKLDLEGI